jgi:hypothetical protein
MNNSELVSQLKQLVATNRFSQTRKKCITELVGKEYKVSGILSRIWNTTGYLRRQGLRKGKTITLRLADCSTELTIRCNRGRSTSIADHNVTKQFSISVTVTGYDDVRGQLKSDELAPSQFTGPTFTGNEDVTLDSVEDPLTSNPFPINQELTSSPTEDQTDQLLAVLDQMQTSSINLLSKVADDINKAQSRDIPLLVAGTEDEELTNLNDFVGDQPTELVDGSGPADQIDLGQPHGKPKNHDELMISHPNPDVKYIGQSSVLDRTKSAVNTGEDNAFRSTLTERLPVVNPEQKPFESISDIDVIKKKKSQETHSEKNRHLVDHLRLEILSDQQDPISDTEFGQLISLTTGVPLEKVSEIQKELWRAVMNPSMFGKQRNIYNFFPFGDFKMSRDRETINMGFKSAPVTQLAKHNEVENYPHSNFGTSDADSDHPPIAAHAVRIAATVVPIVGLSLPVTYDVIFETLQLLLKIFGVGKRRVSFSDIGEFVPVVLNGTLQYHFRPYRQLIRFVTESARAIIAIAEREGEGQLAFEADKGVPDRTVLQSRTRGKVERDKKNSNGCVLIILAIVVYQALKYLFG